MNGTLVLAFNCLSFGVWSEPGPFGNGQVLHGETTWFMKDIQAKIGLDYKVVTVLPKPKHPVMATLAMGGADMAVETYGISYQRSKFIDFSYTQESLGVHIISGRNTDYAASNVVIGVFDDLSYGMALVSLCAMILTTWLILHGESRGHLVITTVLYMFGNSLKQPIVTHVLPKRNFGLLIVYFFSIYNTLICLMYSSVIISMLTKMKEPKQIDSMADLNKTENAGIRIFLIKDSSVPERLESSNKLIGFENRIDYIDRPPKNITEEEKTKYIINSINSIRKRSHVLINKVNNKAKERGYLDYFMCQLNKRYKETMFKRADFRVSRYHNSVCTRLSKRNGAKFIELSLINLSMIG